MPGVTIRLATPRDATDLVALIDMAGEGLPSYFWSQAAEDGQSPFEIGRARAMAEKGPFSYRNARIAEIGGNVAGAVICRPIDDPADLGEVDDLHEIVQPLVRLEAEAPGALYVNVLAVYPEYRGKGIGAELLAHADAGGRTAASRGMAIIVASENVVAWQLYEHSGYREKARLPLVGYPGYGRGDNWILLTKPHS
jgi:ribosomal protein S18 acetylase RimI-like enzyme